MANPWEYLSPAWEHLPPGQRVVQMTSDLADFARSPGDAGFEHGGLSHSLLSSIEGQTNLGSLLRLGVAISKAQMPAL